MSAGLNAIEKNYSIEYWNTYKYKVCGLKNNYMKRFNDDLAFAHSFCCHVMKHLWDLSDYKSFFVCRECNFEVLELDIDAVRLAREIAEYFSSLPIVECGYYVGILYMLLLPEKYKTELGIFYTPPVIAERLLDLLESAGAGLINKKIVDPSCGGGAFLIPITNRVMHDHRVKSLTPEKRIAYLEDHINGIEIDSFAGWITQVLLDILTYDDAVSAGRRISNIVKIENTIEYALKSDNKYDLIIGNPPYGRISLEKKVREAYSRSLFGHANMYGLFIDSALRMLDKGGLIGFVTPTSFLGGEYFKNLRKLLINEAPPIIIDFVSARAGVFENVLQETCLAVFSKNEYDETTIHNLRVNDSCFMVNKIGKFNLNFGNSPWIIPSDTLRL